MPSYASRKTGNVPPRSGERPLTWRHRLTERLFLPGIRMQFPDRDCAVPVAEGDSAKKNAPGTFIAECPGISVLLALFHSMT